MVGYIYDPGALRGGSKLLPYGFAAPLILIGIYLVAPVFGWCDYLLITTRSGRRKLPMKSCNPCEVVNAGKTFGYLITARVAP